MSYGPHPVRSPLHAAAPQWDDREGLHRKARPSGALGRLLLAYLPDHPLRRSQGRVYEHRAVFYQHHGDGPFRCHCCGAVVSWDDMHVDHLDDNPKNNAPGNLAPACPTCNQKRGQHKVMATLRRKHGLTIDGITLTINEWAAKIGVVNGSSIALRLKKGWAVRDAVMTPAWQRPAGT